MKRLAFLASLVLAGSAQAQGTGHGFMFREPRGSLALRGGFAVASAVSDLFAFTAQQLTVNRSDFSSATGDLDLSLRLSPRFDLSLGASYSGRTTPSEFRDWVDQDDQAIRQTTSFKRAPLTASFKAYLTPRGRSIGRYAWIPARIAFYAGLGGGVMWYQFNQRGDFIDFQTLDVFPDRFESSGFIPTAHAMAGTELSLSPRFAFTAEARYTYGRASLDSDFSGFEPLDLSGASLTAGLLVRY